MIIDSTYLKEREKGVKYMKNIITHRITINVSIFEISQRYNKIIFRFYCSKLRKDFLKWNSTECYELTSSKIGKMLNK